MFVFCSYKSLSSPLERLKIISALQGSLASENDAQSLLINIKTDLLLLECPHLSPDELFFY